MRLPYENLPIKTSSSGSMAIEPDFEGVELPGLPHGLLAVAFRKPVDGEFYFTGSKIGKAEYCVGGYPQMLVVKASASHVLRYDILGDTYRPVNI